MLNGEWQGNQILTILMSFSRRAFGNILGVQIENKSFTSRKVDQFGMFAVPSFLDGFTIF